MPTFAFINGMALGGGLEVTLHCDYRTVSKAAAGIALPECFLGMFPGWGGAYLLPNLIGARPRGPGDHRELAVPEQDAERRRRPTQLGIADALFDGADFLERSLDWAGQVVSGTLTVDRPEIDRGEAWDAALARGRAFADSKVSGASPGPYRALELMAAAKTADRAAAYAAEDEGLADLIMGPELRASLYAFELVRKRARKPAGAPDPALARPITKIGVVGAGLMASQLALLFLRRLKVPVVISDLDQERVDSGLGYVHAEIDKLLAKKRIVPRRGQPAARADLAAPPTSPTTRDCDFVIEAVFEELAIKKQVFADAGEARQPELRAGHQHLVAVGLGDGRRSCPSRAGGRLPLLQPGRRDAPARGGPRRRPPTTTTLATALSRGQVAEEERRAGQGRAGFVVNRLLLRMHGRDLRGGRRGHPDRGRRRGACGRSGLPMPPFVLLQLVGPAVALHVGETLHAAFGERFPVSADLRALVAADKPGHLRLDRRRASRTCPRRPGADQLRRPAEHRGPGPGPYPAGLAEEIGLMLAEGVVASPMDIDLCLILGAGWPFHLGGITPYLDREGVSEQVLGRRFLPPGVASPA